MRERWESWRKRRAIAGVRREMGLLGFGLEHLTDEEIEAGVQRVAEAARASMVTAQEAAVAIQTFVAALPFTSIERSA